jgi:2'-5' RNA ligase
MPNPSAARTVLALRLPEVDLLFGDLRHRYGTSLKHSFGPHIAIRNNFTLPGGGTADTIQMLAAACTFTAPFEIALTRVGYFRSTVYFAPEPTGPIHRLETRISQLFPPSPMDVRRFKSHVVMGKGLLPPQAVTFVTALEHRIKQSGALLTVCSELSLMSFEDDQWNVINRFVFGNVVRTECIKA